MQDNLNDIIKTVLERMPQPSALFQSDPRDPTTGNIVHVGLPANFKLERIDLEKLLPHPRRTSGAFAFTEAASFVEYVNHHAPEWPSTTVWCVFDPTTSKLSFRAVFDEHAPDKVGWRGHHAFYEPMLAPEWKTCIGSNGSDKAQGQLEFALWLEQHGDDIVGDEHFPNSAAMLAMARDFENNAERTLKNRVNLQSGTVELVYVDREKPEIETKMRAFEKFKIGVPVFWKRREGGQPVQAYAIEARLRYRVSSRGAVFWYELIRPELAHEKAALDVVEQIRIGIGQVPLRFGGVA